MAAHPAPFCTDEELLQELKKLGYKDVPTDVFLMMKEDLSQLVSKEQYHTDNPAKEHGNKSDLKYPSQQNKLNQANIKYPNTFPTSEIVQINSLLDNLSHCSDISADDLSLSKYRNNLRIAKSQENLKHFNGYQISEEDKQSHSNITAADKSSSSGDISSNSGDISFNEYNNSTKSFKVNSHFKSPENNKSENTKINLNEELLDNFSSSENVFLCKYSISLKNSKVKTEETVDRSKTLENTKISVNKGLNASSSSGDISFSKYRNSLENFKAAKNQRENVMAGRGLNSSSSSVSIEGNKIKRKVMRHQNGKPVITEEFIEIPAIFSTSYPETEVPDTTIKSVSSEDLSFKSNSSTGSACAVSPNPSETPRSTVSTRSVQSRGINQRKKKTDPVAMYNYYKKFWNDFKPPGEKNHDKLRWAVRDRMLDYNL